MNKKFCFFKRTYDLHFLDSSLILAVQEIAVERPAPLLRISTD